MVVLIIIAVLVLGLVLAGFVGSQNDAQRLPVLEAAARPLGGLEASARGTLVDVRGPSGWDQADLLARSGVEGKSGTVGLAPDGWVWVSNNGTVLSIRGNADDRSVAYPNEALKLFETDIQFGYGTRTRFNGLDMTSYFHVRCPGDGPRAARDIRDRLDAT